METRVPILMYHKVAPIHPRALVKGHYVSPGMFARHIRMLRALRFESVALNGLFETEQNLPKRPFVITFDDGYQNFFDNALPTLKKASFVSTVFLVANQLGGVNAWDASLGDVSEPLMDVESIRTAAAAGTAFGSHTLDHVDLKLANAAEAMRQISGSKSLLENALEMSIESFCYPYGRMNQDTPGYVRSAGYRLACSTLKGTNTEQTDRYALRRINVRSDTWTPVLWLKLLRAARNGN
jgi:peptidoglycan/xylan/chitin deacetylase (PgdA/CDA1 family)